jgi:hypothetical protein
MLLGSKDESHKRFDENARKAFSNSGVCDAGPKGEAQDVPNNPCSPAKKYKPASAGFMLLVNSEMWSDLSRSIIAESLG